MGFSSAGLGCGSSFFFELPLYSQSVAAPGLSTTDEVPYQAPAAASTINSLPPALRSAASTEHMSSGDDCVMADDQSHFITNNEANDDNIVYRYSPGPLNGCIREDSQYNFDRFFQRMLPPLHFSNIKGEIWLYSQSNYISYVVFSVLPMNDASIHPLEGRAPTRVNILVVVTTSFVLLYAQ